MHRTWPRGHLETERVMHLNKCNNEYNFINVLLQNPFYYGEMRVKG